MSFPLVKYVLLAALRDRLFLSMLVVIAVTAALSIFLGSSAVIESDSFSLVFAGSGIRIVSVMGLVLFIVFYVRRSFDTGDVDFILTRPVNRTAFVLSHVAAFSVLAVFTAFLGFWGIVITESEYFDAGKWLWIASFLVELLIIVNVSLFFSLMLTSAASASMAVFGFYVLGRLMGEIMGIASTGLAGEKYEWATQVMQGIAMFMPRLDLLGQSSWLIYGPGDSVGMDFIVYQGVLYCGLLVLASLLDFTRKQF